LISKNNLFDTLTKILEKQLKKIKISGEFYLIRYENTDIYIAMSFDKQKFINSVLMPFFDNYSELSRLHITSKQIQIILDDMKSVLDCEIISDRIIAYGRLDKNKITIRRKQRLKESDVRWTEEEYKTSFTRAAENDQWIDKIYFYAQKDDKIIFNASLSRSGFFRCDKNAKEFYKILSNHLLTIGKQNTDIFDKKSRMENNGEIRPVFIEYSNNIFENVEQNKRLIKSLSEFPKSSYSVYHGNPYLHMSMVDYCDGSSYDIWVVSSNRLIIIPQLRATFNSLSRLCEHILKRFMEGKLGEMRDENDY
jgi:hypothetical protein